MKKIVLFFICSFLIFITNTSFAESNLKNSIEENIKKYDKFIINEYIYLKNEADKDLFNPALKKCKNFAEKYYNERDNQVIIRNKLKTELFNKDVWEDYLLGVIRRIELKSRELSVLILYDAGLEIKDNSVPMVEIYVDNVDGNKIRKELSIDRVVKDIYNSLESCGANKVPSREVERLFEKYSAKYKDTLLTLKYFSQLLLVVSPVANYTPTNAVLFGLVNLISDYLYNNINDKINDYRIHLMNSVIKSEEKFNETLRKISVDELEKVIDYYKNIELNKFFMQ